jgi:hypothetical protein
VPVGTARAAYLLDYGAAGTMVLATTDASGSESYAASAAILTLMVGLSTFSAPGG